MDKRVLVGIVAIGAAAVGAYYLLLDARSPAVDVEPVESVQPIYSNSFLNSIVSDSMVSIGMGEKLGIRNNNPTNIVYTSFINWNGQTGQDHGFCVFDTPINGIRAAAKNLDSYLKAGRNTIATIIPQWSKTDVAAYIKNVESWTGIDRNAIIGRRDYPSLIAAMIRMENGKQPYPMATIQAGINAA